MSLLKSNQLPSPLMPFSLADIERQAQAIIEQASKQAGEFLDKARDEAAALMVHGRELGLAQGHAEGVIHGRQEGRASGMVEAFNEYCVILSQLTETLASAAAEFDRRRQALEADAVREVVDLSLAIAQRITKLQGRLDGQVVMANVAEAMKLALHSADVRIAVNPAQKMLLNEALPKLKMQWPSLRHVEIVEDVSLAPGGCRIFTAQGQVDADMDSQLQRIAADLVPGGLEAKA